MKNGIVQADGSQLAPGDWVHIKFKSGEYVGRFSGLYENPRHGLMYYLSFARRLDDPVKHDTIYCAIRPENGGAEALKNAVVVEKPKVRSGKITIKPLLPDGTVIH